MNWLTMPLKVVCALIGVFWMFLAGVAYTVWLPAGWPNYRLPIPVIHPTIHLPWAGAVEAAKTRTAFDLAQWSQCRANEAALTASVEAQNRAVAALKLAGDRMTANAQRAVQLAENGLAAAQKRAAQIMAAPPSSPDQCIAAEALIRATVR